jgi:hypothetical protein
MNDNSRKLIAVMSFVVTCIIAFFITKSCIKDEQEEIIVEPGPNEPDDSLVVDTDTLTTPFNSPELRVIKKEKKGNAYFLQVTCNNLPDDDIVIYYVIEELNRKSNDGKFNDIPGSKDGKYTVVAKDSESNEKITTLIVDGFNPITEEISIQKMTIGEFQRLLLNQNDNSLLGGKNPRVALYVKLTCAGLRDGDFAAGDIQHVRDKVANGIWKSATVLDVKYNEKGQINAATIRPVYE